MFEMPWNQHRPLGMVSATAFHPCRAVLAFSRSRARRVSVRGLSLLLTLGLSSCTSVFLQPDRTPHLPNRALGTPVEERWITAPDGNAMHALYLPAQATPRGTVLFLHGNAENVSSHVHSVTWLPSRGYAVLAPDYRGFGRSRGEAGVASVHEDAEAALAWLASPASGAAAPLILYGQSLGGSIAIRLVAESASRAQVAAVIADSAFSSYRDIAREKLAQLWLTWPLQWPLSLLISDRYSAIDVAERVSPVPMLLIHGQRDIVVDARHSQRLYAAAREPKQLWLIPDGRHTDAVSREPIRSRLVEFLNTTTGQTAGAERPLPDPPVVDD